jgi:glycerophosphoryl diester phosphodiesterase
MRLLMCVVFSEQNAFKHNGVTAHRGNSSEYPENTIAAFQSALSLGVDWIELDIHKTGDNQIVVIHDAETGRVGDTNLQVCRVPFKELKSVDVAHQFRTYNNLPLADCPSASVPLLADVIRLVMEQSETRISIQPKADCVKEAVMIVKDLEAVKWIGFNDGNLRKMKQVKKHAESIPVFWDRPANTDIDKDLRIAQREAFEAIVINHNGMTKAKVEKIHQAGLQVGAWTVNDASRMESLLAVGVDRIYTDYPGLLLQLHQKKWEVDACS